MPIRRRLQAIFAAIFLLALPGKFLSAQPEHPLVVVFVDGMALYSWQEDDSSAALKVLAAGAINRPLLAPDTKQVVFQLDRNLWLIPTTTNNPTGLPRKLVSPQSLTDPTRYALDFAWLNNNTIVFNTYHFNPKLLVQQQFADDLWSVDVASGTSTRLLDDGDGGAFTISPDRTTIALVRPGDFASHMPGVISVVDAQGKNPVKLLEFPFVNTGSSANFYPQPQWSADSRSLWVAVPDPNLVYATQNIPLTALFQFGVDGAQTRLGSVRADYFGLPQFSPDGKYILYARRIGSIKDNQLALFQAKSDGSDEQEIVWDAIGTLEPARWIPDSACACYTFVHGNPGETWSDDVTTGKKSRFPANKPDQTVFNLTWADDKTFVYAESPGGPLTIVTLGQNQTIDLKRQSGGDFDTRRKP